MLLLALDPAPAVVARDDIAAGDVAHVLAVARRHDPRRASFGEPARLDVTERDLELMLNHAAHRLLGQRVRLALEAGEAVLTTSGPAPALPLLAGRWINLELRLRQADGLPALSAWRVGRLPLPTALAAPLLRWAAARQDLALAGQVVRQVRFGHDVLSLDYVWQPETSQRLMSLLTPQAEQERLRAYSDLLVSLTHRHGPAWTIPLPDLIAPLFDLARQRSLTHDAAQENRAAILTLALYATGQSLGRLVPAARGWPQPRRLQVLLNGRNDFPQHFLVSAALAIESTTPLTNAVGLYKEIADSRGGTGFSFNDLAANRAGLRFGEFALREPERLQGLLSRGVSELSLMPDVRDLPEFLSAAEFARRYGRIGSPDYERLMADIERRVDGLALYR